MKFPAELKDTKEHAWVRLEGAGWMIAVALQDPGVLDGLMSAVEYEAYVAEIAG